MKKDPEETLMELKKNFHQKLKYLQIKIIDELYKIDMTILAKKIKWNRKDFKGNDGGGGLTQSLHGDLIEHAAVNTSLVYGEIDPDFGKTLLGKSSSIWACGLSIIIHPRNPRIPSVHANFRMMQSGDKIWFGGGSDLTPYYPHLEDFYYFHKTWEKACSTHYQWMKKKCDEYFVNHHRNGEMRGIGGFFFDHFYSGNPLEDYHLVTNLADNFIDSYFPIVQKRKNEIWTEEEEEFQLYRRGRYVEFNLLHDRGTLFGLKSGGRVESILSSLPPRCRFNYTHHPDYPFNEMEKYYKPCNWIDEHPT